MFDATHQRRCCQRSVLRFADCNWIRKLTFGCSGALLVLWLGCWLTGAHPWADAAAVATPPPGQVPAAPLLDPHPAFRAQVIRVHDGDTALFRLQLEAGVYVEVWVRFEGFNAPELNGPHKELAAQATRAASTLFTDGPIWVKLTGSQTFARYVGRVYVVQNNQPIDVSQKLTDLGYQVEQGQ
jgi:endonuclease YncB( thermonuclease family)